MALKSSPANANRLRACTPYSSTVRARSVVSRQCQANLSPSNTPKEVFVFPTSTTSSISPLPSQHLFDCVGRGRRAVLRAYLFAHLRGARSVTLFREERAQFFRGRGGVVPGARQHAARADARDARAVVELVVAEGDDEGRYPCAQPLGGCADAALVDDGAGARQQLAVGRVVEGGGPLGEFSGAVPGLAREEQGARPGRARRRER